MPLPLVLTGHRVEPVMSPTGLLYYPVPSVLDFPAGYRFLGHYYPSSDINFEALASLPQPRDLCLSLLDPHDDVRRLTALLTFRPQHIRAMYRWCLYALHQRALAHELEEGLANSIKREYEDWVGLDEQWLRSYVLKHFTSMHVGAEDHWVWKNHRKYGKNNRPVVAWHRIPDVPVHRLLWPVARPTELLTPLQNLRKTWKCPDSSWQDCVNPHHFEIATPRSEYQDTLPGIQNTRLSGHASYNGYTRWEVAWGPNVDAHTIGPVFNDVLGQWIEGIICPRCRTALGSDVQKRYRQAMTPGLDYNPNISGKARCPRCYDRFNEEVGTTDGKRNRRSRGQRKLNFQAQQSKLNADAAQRTRWEQEILARLPQHGGSEEEDDDQHLRDAQYYMDHYASEEQNKSG